MVGAPGVGVVVVAPTQPPAVQLSQQLGTVPTHAEPPTGALHFVALDFREHFVLPVAVHGFRQWTPFNRTDSHALSPQLLAEVQKLPKGAVVIADPETSYRIAAAAPVYVVAAPIAHVANTKANG